MNNLNFIKTISNNVNEYAKVCDPKLLNLTYSIIVVNLASEYKRSFGLLLGGTITSCNKKDHNGKRYFRILTTHEVKDQDDRKDKDKNTTNFYMDLGHGIYVRDLKNPTIHKTDKHLEKEKRLGFEYDYTISKGNNEINDNIRFFMTLDLFDKSKLIEMGDYYENKYAKNLENTNDLREYFVSIANDLSLNSNYKEIDITDISKYVNFSLRNSNIDYNDLLNNRDEYYKKYIFDDTVDINKKLILYKEYLNTNK